MARAIEVVRALAYVARGAQDTSVMLVLLAKYLRINKAAGPDPRFAVFARSLLAM
jgi:hypothetical protein